MALVRVIIDGVEILLTVVVLVSNLIEFDGQVLALVMIVDVLAVNHNI